MPSVLKNFLIGVGMDTEDYDKGAKRVEGSLGRMRSVVGFTGAAMVGAFAAVGAAAVARASQIDDFVLATEGLKTSRQYVYDYGNALKLLGGNADDAIAAIRTIEEAQSDFRLKGMLGPLEDLALARGDIEALSQTASGKDFLRTLAPMVQKMDKDQQRLVQRTLGLTDAVMRSLRGGVGQLDASVANARDLAGNLESAVGAARDFNRELAGFNIRMEGIGNTLAEKVLPGFTGVLQSMGGFLDEHKEQINAALGVASDSPGATALAAGGGAASAAGVALRGIGMRGVGMGLTRLGAPGMIAGGGLMAYDAAKDWRWGDWWDQSVEGARDTWHKWAWDKDYSRLPDAPYGPAVPDVGPGFDVRPLPAASYDAEVPAVPVYSGGEVSNAEAAQASPDVVLIRDQRQQADKPTAPQRVDVQNHLDVKMELDGRAFDKRVTEVVERRERNTADDIISSVDR